MKFGETVFDMNHRVTPSGSASTFLMKRWKKHTVYSKSGPYNRTQNPADNEYATSSVYLYDYIAVSKDWYASIVYTSSYVDTTPGPHGTEAPGGKWTHDANTFRDRPNAKTNNYLLTEDGPSSIAYGRPIYNPPYIFLDNGEYLELVTGYPRNHFTHKRTFFSIFREITYSTTGKGVYKRNSQNTSTTVGADGLEDGSPPIEIIRVGNVKLVQGNNTINQ